MEEKKITIGGLAVNFKTFGKGLPVLVLHGWGGRSDSWSAVGEALAQKGYQVICPDLPGFGASHEPKKAWQFQDYLDWAAKFTDSVGLGRFFLVGHSLGGALACAYAALNPQKIKKLVLCDAAIIREERLDWRQKEAKNLASKKQFLLELPFAAQFYPLAQKIVYRLAGSHDYQLASPLMKETFKNVIKVDSRGAAQKITIPSLIIWGRNDKSTLLEDAYAINKLIAVSKLEIIDGAGHNPHRTHPVVLADKIADFFNHE